MENDFDNKVLNRINDYILTNGLSLRKIAEEAGMGYVPQKRRTFDPSSLCR